MIVYKTRWFAKWAKKEKITDEALVNAVSEMDKGLIDADLGGCVFKKRVAIPGKGKRSGTRTILAYKVSDRSFFIFGFAKNKRDNVSDKEVQALQILAEDLLSYTEPMLTKAVESKELIEVKING
jgi:hypothetical protein